MVERATTRNWAAGAARMLAGAAGWIALAAGVAPWSTRDGDVLVGVTPTLGLRDLGVADVDTARWVDWVATIHGVDAWLLPVTAVALWVGAVRWRSGARWEVAAAAALLLVHGVVGLVLPLVAADGRSLWYGPHLALAAGVAGLVGWLVARSAPPSPAPDRSAEARLRDAVVDLDLDRHVAPRLIRVLWAVLASALVAGYVVSVVAGVFELLRAQAVPPTGDIVAAVVGVVAGLVVVLVALVVLRAVADLLIVPFRIVERLRAPLGADVIGADAGRSDEPEDEEPSDGQPEDEEREAPDPGQPVAPDAAEPSAPPAEPAGPRPGTAPPPEPRAEPSPAPPPRPEPPPRPPSRTEPPSTPPRPRTEPPPQPRARPAESRPPSEDGPEPWVARPPRPSPEGAPRPPAGPDAEPEPWMGRAEPPKRLEGTADQWYREPADEPRPPAPPPRPPAPPEATEARGIPEDDPEGHPLRRRTDDEGSSGEDER